MDHTVSVPRIFKNTAIMVVSQIIIQLIAFFTSIQIANYLGVELFGVYSFAFSFTTIFTFAVDAGLNFAAFRAFSQDRENITAYYQKIIAIKCVLGITIVLLFWLVASIIHLEHTAAATILLGFIILVITSINGVALSAYQAWEKMEYLALSELLHKVIIFSLVVWYVVKINAGIYPVFSVIIVAGTTVLLLNIAMVSRLDRNIWSGQAWRITTWWPVIKLGLPFILIGLLNQLYLYIDISLLKFMKGDHAVGIYTPASRVITMGILMPAALVNAVFPALNKIQDMELFKKLINMSCKYLFLVAIPLGVGLAILAKQFILFFYKAEYALSASCLQILVWALVLMFGNWVIGHALYALKKDKVMMGVVGITVAVNVLANLLLIPRWSFFGASIAAVLSEIVIITLELYFLFKFIRFKIELRPILKIMGCAMVMGAVIYGLHDHLYLWTTAAVGLAVFMALITLTRTVTIDEFKRLRNYKATV
jgi:O-antigen/teichoic acid export membrane protein